MGDPSADRRTDTSATPTQGDVAPAWMPRTIRQGIWWAIAAVLLTVGALWFLSVERTLVRYLVAAALLALGLEPAVNWLHQRRGWRRGTATGLLLVGTFVGILIFAGSMAALVANETTQIVEELPAYIDKLNAFTIDHFDTSVVSPSQRAEAEDAVSNINEYLRDHTSEILGGLASFVSGIFSIFTVGLFTFYLTADGPKVRRALLARLRPEKQERALFAWETAIKKVGGYLYSRLLLASINGGLMFITLKAVGAPFALPLAIFVGLVAAFIPIVGTYIAGTVPALVVLAERGPVSALVVVVEILLYQLVENYYLSPRISAKTIELNPGVAFGAAMAGGAVGGFLGAFFALPIAATIQEFISAYSTTYEVRDSRLLDVDAKDSTSSARAQERG